MNIVPGAGETVLKREKFFEVAYNPVGRVQANRELGCYDLTMGEQINIEC